MVFSSLEFIFRFLPIFLLLYYVVPYKYRNIILFIGSICFYTLGEPKYVLLIILSIFVNYYAAIFIERANDTLYKRRIWLILVLIYDLGILFFFKYINFAIENMNALMKGISGLKALPLLNITLPLGISFYTFQIVAYIIDVYRKKIPVEKSIFGLSVYVTMFPQLISGPIVVYSDIVDQIKNRNYSLKSFEKGLKLFTIGLGFKVLLANRIAILWNDIQTIGFESISTPLAWVGIFGYSLQLYFDFHGYSLMAIGVGKMLGFTLPANFTHPYMSKSVTEFWRRWHITLGTWFKNYVYIPLGGNRKGILRLILNLFIVWMLTGLWHGASWNFVLWGFSLFVLIFVEKMFLKKYLDKSNLLSRIYLLTMIPLTWMVFAITKLSDIKIYFGRLFSIIPGISVNNYDVIKYLSMYKWLFLLGIFFCTPIGFRWFIKHENSIPCVLFLLVVFWYSIYQLANGINNPFVYFRF